MYYKVLPVDRGNIQGVVQRELSTQDGIPDPGGSEGGSMANEMGSS